jgi:hypothetical protein
MSAIDSEERIQRRARMKANLESKEHQAMIAEAGRQLIKLHGGHAPLAEPAPPAMVGWDAKAQEAMRVGIESLDLPARTRELLIRTVDKERTSYYVFGRYYPVEMRESDWKNAAGFLNTTYLTFEEWAADIPNRIRRIQFRLNQFGPKSAKALLDATRQYHEEPE